MKLPDKILAFKILEGATISENQRLMCLTLANDQTFNSMKTALKRTFSDQKTFQKMLQISLKILILTLNLGGKLILKIKKGKLQDRSFVIQKRIGQKLALINQIMLLM